MPTELRPDYAELLHALRLLPSPNVVGHPGYEEVYRRVIRPLLDRVPEP